MKKHLSIFIKQLACLVLLLLGPLISAQSPQRIIVRLDNHILADTVIVSTDSVIFIDFSSSVVLSKPSQSVSLEKSPTLQESKVKNTNRNNIRTQCMATTKRGNRCSRMAKPGSKYCWQHAR